MRLLLIGALLLSTSLAAKEVAVYDSIKPNSKRNQHGEVVIGRKLPDWSDVELDGKIRYIETLMVVDPELARFYNNDDMKIRQAIRILMHGVNQFLFQLDLRMIVVDVTRINAINQTLDEFMHWRQEQMANLVPHDLAIQVRLRYEGGIAFVNGVCRMTAVGISGFFPESPFEYATVFFHELAHLLGLAHDSGGQCKCTNWRNCLRVDGFNKDCAVQALANMLGQHECIQEPPTLIPRSVVQICGNGVLEGDEQCDCGPTKFCSNPLCRAATCEVYIQDRLLYVILALTFSLVLMVCLCSARNCCCPPKKRSLLESPSGCSASSTPPPYKENRYMFPVLGAVPAGKGGVSLDLSVPTTVKSGVILGPDYVKMTPPTPEVLRKMEAKVATLPRARPLISDPVPLVVASRSVASPALAQVLAGCTPVRDAAAAHANDECPTNHASGTLHPPPLPPKDIPERDARSFKPTRMAPPPPTRENKPPAPPMLPNKSSKPKLFLPPQVDDNDDIYDVPAR